MSNEPDKAVEAQRIRCWNEFSEAAEAGARGEWGQAQRLVENHPIVAGELRAYIRWLKAGRPKKSKAA